MSRLSFDILDDKLSREQCHKQDYDPSITLVLALLLPKYRKLKQRAEMVSRKGKVRLSTLHSSSNNRSVTSVKDIDFC